MNTIESKPTSNVKFKRITNGLLVLEANSLKNTTWQEPNAAFLLLGKRWGRIELNVTTTLNLLSKC